MDLVIGIDFDNTLVSYDVLIQRVATERGWIDPQKCRTKREVREAVRNLPDGEVEWQRLQGMVYGPRIGEAEFIESVRPFFFACHQNRAKVYIVSHKTQTAKYDETQTDLRRAALGWMTENGFFEKNGLGLSPEGVFFEGTRKEKLERIEKLGCTHFIDDLEEVFLEEGFPSGITKILYAPSATDTSIPDSSSSDSRLPAVIVAPNWDEITSYVFAPRD